MLDQIDPTRGGVRLTIAPEGGGVTVERFCAALQAAADLIEATTPGSEPMWYGGHVAEGGAVTFEAGPARDAPAGRVQDESP